MHVHKLQVTLMTRARFVGFSAESSTNVFFFGFALVLVDAFVFSIPPRPPRRIPSTTNEIVRCRFVGRKRKIKTDPNTTWATTRGFGDANEAFRVTESYRC